ncbi:MAG: HlyD family secretion protein [Gammaproteobacteria bacterium]|nr:HlyD family secretion protein [Gammaproteobacteria bacterium]
MNDGLLSPHWYRVAKLRPILHSHIEIHRHDYRGLIWYLLEDTTTGRSHRFSPAAYQFIGLLDGNNNVQSIHKQICNQLEDFAPGQEEIIQLLGQLHAADLIQTNVLTDTEELFERQAKQKRSKLKQRFSNPVIQKIPLWDPEEFLNRHFNKLSWLFTYPVAIAWVFFISYALAMAIINWPQINENFTINALAPYNLLLLFLLYPPIKILHELGHAFSAKMEGGEVHEMGITFMLFMPIPYVNVSTATHFRSKYKRILVSAAGILVESFLAALGLLLFLAAEPGLIQDIGFNIFLIGGISSLFFNGNPLLKYDGYYILADLLGIPNLFQRSSQYWRYLFQFYLFGIKTVDSPANAPGEPFWFLLYSVLSLLYRLAVLWFILSIVTDKFFFLGIVLAIWLIGIQIAVPLFKALKFVYSSPLLKQNRNRAILSSSTLIAVFTGLFGFTPIPSYTMAEGVLWQPDEAQIKAQQDGFAGPLEVQNNQLITEGTSVIRLIDPFLLTEKKIARAKVNELESQYRAKRFDKHVKASIIKDAIGVAESELEFIQHKIDSMSVKAFKSGRILLPDADDLPGRYVNKGELLGYILDEQPPSIRVAVKQDNIGQLREKILNINIRLANDLHTDYTAKIIRQAPEATNYLPSEALSTKGGGKFIIDPTRNDPLFSLEKTFQVDLKFEPKRNDAPLGTRVYVRFDHGGEPLATQWIRKIRQVFLRQFNV